MHKNHFVPILLTITVLALCGLGFEYLSELDIKEQRAEQAAVRPTLIRRPGQSAQPDKPSIATAPDLPVTTRHTTPSNTVGGKAALPLQAETPQPVAGGVVRCVLHGRTTYSDRPCAPESITTSINTQPASQGLSPDVPYQAQLAQIQQMHSSPAKTEVHASQNSPSVPDVVTRCKWLAQRIVWIDSALRQPHDAYLGDVWTKERKEASDERFRLECARH